MEGKSMRSMKMACLNTGTEINTVLWRWFCTACATGYPISGPILQSKALSIAKHLSKIIILGHLMAGLKNGRRDTMSNPMLFVESLGM
jgi:hypothetical protein